MHRMHLLAGCATIALAAHTDQGTDPVNTTDAMPLPLTADQAAPAEPAPDPAAAAVGLAPGENASPPINAKAAKAAAKMAEKAEGAKAKPKNAVVMVWVQPGHETFGIGRMIRTPTELGEQLRAAGRARFASDAEIEAAGDQIADVEGV